jgi:endonuclease/exonuclease/phosphatase family metal-dependent hydrolase
VAGKVAEEDKQVFSKLKEEGVKTAIEKDAKPLLKKLVWANTKRSHEVDELVKIFEEKQIPTILTGDFNDTPFSYTYREFKKHLNDAFVEKGKGFGTTYNGDLPAYRIDYIFYDKNYFSVKSFERAALENSDHFPVSAVLSISKDNN